MWSPLDPTISEFYRSHIENKIFQTIITKPKIYVRYVDDIFITTYSYDEINKLKSTQENNSLLKFTNELNINNKKKPFPRQILEAICVKMKTINILACNTGTNKLNIFNN